MSQPKDFGFGSDEALLRDQARRFLDRHASPERVRALVATDPAAVYERGELPGRDPVARARAAELGYFGLAVPEAHGGAGAKAVAVAAFAEEVGRHAFPSPLLVTHATSYVLGATHTDAAAAVLARIAEGTAATLALTNAKGDWSLHRTEVVARRDGGGFVLSGTAFFVQDPYDVDVFLVAARSEQGIGLFVVPKDDVVLHRDHIVDLTRTQGRVELDDVSVPNDACVAPPGDGLAALEAALPMVLVLTAADLVGTSEWLLETTVEYAKIRKQFDRPIGFFQAVKHPLVDAMMAIDRARSHVYHAACAVDAEPERAESAARMAKSAASDAAAFVAGRAVQLHGGIGFTWEHDVHLFFKRARHGAALWGDGVHHRKRLAEHLLGARP